MSTTTPHNISATNSSFASNKCPYAVDDNTVFFAFDASTTPAIRVPNGAQVRLHTKDCFSNQIQTPEDTIDDLDWNQINPATGPVFIEGAHTGGTLRVHIDNIELGDQAVACTGPDEGVIGSQLDHWTVQLCPVEGDTVRVGDIAHLPVKPMIGVIGVAPQGEAIPCGSPDRHGGNMDNNQITTGATLYFPIACEGALFGLGDMHAVMGDGEIGVSGAEIDGYATVTLQAFDKQICDSPLFEDDENWGVIYSAATLDEAAQGAVERFIQILATYTSHTADDLAILTSLAGSVGVCQMVDPLRTVRCTLPKSVLKEIGLQLPW